MKCQKKTLLFLQIVYKFQEFFMIKKEIEDLELYVRYQETVPRQKKILKELEKDLKETLEILAEIRREHKDGNLTEKDYIELIGHMQEKAEKTEKLRRDQEKNLQDCEEFMYIYMEQQKNKRDKSPLN